MRPQGSCGASPTRATAFYLGRRPYAPIHALQADLQTRRIQGAIGDVVLLLEHEPVITLGRSAKAGNVLFSREALAARGVDLEETGRGGDVTLHAPGQLVGYPILDLRPNRCDLRRYVARLADVMVGVAREHDVEAGTVDGLIGVWVDAEAPSQWATAPWAARLAKIGAIGVRVSRWVTMHGFALNVDVDLDLFRLIVPCGISEHPVASLASLREATSTRLATRTVTEIALGLAAGLARSLDQPVRDVIDLSSVPTSDLGRAIDAEARLPTERAPEHETVERGARPA